MRKLSEQEEQVMIDARNELLKGVNNDERIINAAKFGFRFGFIAGLDYAQKKLNAYAAYVAGKITLSELEEVING